MRKFSLFMLMAVGLLISGVMSAGNVAKVGETPYEDINAAFAAWVTNGGTLTILDDVTFTQTKCMRLENMEYTLDLGGKTLTWQAYLEYSNSQQDVTDKIGAAFYIKLGNTNTVLNIKTSTKGGKIDYTSTYSYYKAVSDPKPTTGCLYFIWGQDAGTVNWESGDFSVHGTDNTQYFCGIVYTSKAMTVNILGGTFTLGDWCQYGIYISCKDAPIVIKDCAFYMTDQQKNTPHRVISFGSTAVNATIENVIIDASGIASSCEGSCVYAGTSTKDKVIIKSGTFTANGHKDAFAACNYVKIEGGTFNGAVKAQTNGISGGKFSILPLVDYIYDADHIFQLNNENNYYEIVEGKYQVAIPRAGTTSDYIGYVNAEDAIALCSEDANTSTRFRYLGDQPIVIPAGKYITLNKCSGTSTITNNGGIIFSGTTVTSCHIINNGTITVTGSLILSGTTPNLIIENNGNMGISNSSATFKQKATIANKKTGTLTITNGTFGVAKKDNEDNNPIITNEEGGTISIEGGKFQSSVIESLAQYVAPGFVVSSSDTNGWRTVGANTSFIAKVGDVDYTTLKDALDASSQETPAKLINDYTLTYSNGMDMSGYLDLNGYSIIGNGVYSSYPMIKVFSNRELHILDSSNEKTGEIYRAPESTTKNGMIIEVALGGTVYLEGGTISASGESAAVTARPNHADAIYGGHIVVDGATIIGEDYGIAVYEYGTLEVKSGSITADGYAILNNGTLAEPSTMTISGGTISGGQMGIYHPGKGTLTITGGEITGGYSGIEIRAGELNMTGGTVTSTYNGVFASAPNGNGATTVGAAIAVAQHTTKQPVNVNISGGELKGLYALVQINPQDNSAADYAKVKVNISGGKFESTNTQSGSIVLYNSTGGTSSISMSYSATDMLLSQNHRIFLTGGYYGMDNGRDPAPFVMPGYVSVLLSSITNPTPEDEQAIIDGYKYKVTKITAVGDEKEARDNGTNWSEDASTLWASTEGGSDGTVPTNVTQVTIGVGKEVIVNTPANAYGIGISQDEQGTTKLTVKDGGMLMIGAGGVNNEKVERFVVEAGGMMALAPTATEQNVKATVEVEVLAGYKNQTASEQELNADNLYWEHIACPTIGERTLNLVDPEDKATGMIVNTWDIVKAWTTASRDDIKTPFVGYNTTNDGVNNSPATYEAGKKVKYVFEGMTVGNKVDPFVFKRDGYTFFGNSYLAPIDIYELLNTLASNDENLEITVAIYNPINNGYDYINRASYIMSDITEIKPLQGFFLHSYGATSTTLDYTKAVWNAFCAKAFTPVQAPRQKECPFEAVAQVNIASESGNDHVMLIQDGNFTSQFENGYDAEKMNVEGAQIFANGTDRNLSVVATDNLIGQTLSMQTSNALTYTLSFSKVNGENLALMDTQTGETIKMTEGNSYTFVAQPNTTLDGRFVVIAAPAAPTQMDKINKKAQVKGIYSIMGQYIGSEQLWNNLPSGVYMINGTKIVK